MPLIALGIGCAVLAGVGYMWMGHRGNGEVPVVLSDPRPIRVAPANPGGMKADEVGERMFSKDRGTDAVHLAPPPEAPKAKPR